MGTRWGWSLVVGLLGCAAPAGQKDGPADPVDPGGSSGDESSSGTAPVTTGDSGSESSSGESSSSSGCGFICEIDMPLDCDVWGQDCETGEKCTPWIDDGGDSWNAVKCVPVDANAGQPGDACTAEGGGGSGIDDCDLGAMCWGVDEAGKGRCVAFCDGSADNPTCADTSTTCVLANDGVLNLCLPVCDALLQDCEPGEACYPVGDAFACGPDVSGELGLFGDACAAINVCDAGLFCAAPEQVPGCAGASGCCSSFCDLADDPTCPGDGQQCVAWFDPGQAPPGAETLGGCAIPD